LNLDCYPRQSSSRAWCLCTGLHSHTDAQALGGPGKAPLFSGTDIDDVRFVYSILRRGRPDVASIVGDAMRTSGVEGRFSKWNPAPVMLAACGPPRLVQGVSEVAFQRNTRFHTEVFAF